MEIAWKVALGLFAIASGLFFLTQTRPRIAARVAAYFAPIAGIAAATSFGGLTSALLAKAAVGALAAGMYAGDFAITDGAPGSDDSQAGRYVISKIAGAIDPIIAFDAYLLGTAIALYAIFIGYSRLAAMTIDERQEDEQLGPTVRSSNKKYKR